MSRWAMVVGARPQFIKAAACLPALEAGGGEVALLHTGQHYDAEMDRVFFDQLGLPGPACNLGVGSDSHARQTAAMMTGLEEQLLRHRPDGVLLFGDTNSTVAGALVAAKLQIPIAHVEAGLRSGVMAMPEEVNRIVTDRLSSHLFCPTRTAVEHLASEGITEGVHLVGDVMKAACLGFRERAAECAPLESIVEATDFVLVTVHRPRNADDPQRLQSILDGIAAAGRQAVWPVHPRVRPRLAEVEVPESFTLLPPVGYLAMLTLMAEAYRVATDSGGVQKEALWLGTPCVTLREETEWVETLAGGWNRLVGADAGAIARALGSRPSGPAPEFGGEGAAQRIAEVLTDAS